jgi:rod shape-determining protein MreC
VGPFFKRYRELIVSGLLLMMPLVTYASHAETESVPWFPRRAVVWATSPVERAIVFAVESAQDAWYSYVDLRDTHAQNFALRAEVHRLRDAQTHLQELEAENTRLRRLVGYAEAAPEMRMIAASVVAYGPDPKYRGIRIGRGATDGLRSGMPVITPDGVVGRLVTVYENTADVLLITDPSSAVAALSQRTRARATARGLSSTERLRLDYVIKSEDLEESDILVTAPSGGLFPKGLRIGRATRVNEGAHGLFKSADLVPFVDFDRLEEVQVVVENAPSARLERPATSFAR